MTYEEFKKQKDAEFAAKRKEMERRANIAYNNGLWDAVKCNPFKWWVFLAFMRKI